jgi:hypothetical protein
MTVYFAQTRIDMTKVKIGFSSDVEARRVNCLREGGACTVVESVRRLLPWSMRNFIANKLLEWSGSFADAAMWIAPEMNRVLDDEEEDDEPKDWGTVEVDSEDLPF